MGGMPSSMRWVGVLRQCLFLSLRLDMDMVIHQGLELEQGLEQQGKQASDRCWDPDWADRTRVEVRRRVRRGLCGHRAVGQTRTVRQNPIQYRGSRCDMP